MIRCPVCNAKYENGIMRELIETLKLAQELMRKLDSVHPHEIAFVKARIIAALQIAGERN